MGNIKRQEYVPNVETYSFFEINLKKRTRGSRDIKEFKVMIIKMLRRKLDEHSENFNEELENKKELNRAEEFSNWIEKYNRMAQQQTRWGRRTNQ